MGESNTDFLAMEAMALARAAAPAHDTADGGKIVIVPHTYRAEKIPPLEPPLPRIRAAVTMHDADSFIAYVNRYKTSATRLFAEPGFLAGGAAHVTAVLDYHKPDAADYGAHTVAYQPRYSDQWKRWQSACLKPMAQAEFAEFIEEVRADIHEPSAAQLLDVVRAFKASKKVEFDSVIYQSNGDVRLIYDEWTEQKGTSGVLPEQMKLGIPVYFRGAVYAVPLFVRFRVERKGDGGGVQFQLKLDRADVIEDAAFSEVTKLIGEQTLIEVYLGRQK